LTGGVNRLPPVGLIDFSVGDTVADDDGVVVVVDVSGAFSPPPHAAVSPTIATIAVPPTAAAIRRARRFDLIVSPLLSPSKRTRGLRRIAQRSGTIRGRHRAMLLPRSYTSPIPKWVLMIKTLTYWSGGCTATTQAIHESAPNLLG
jgi:hypothetical protein